MKRVGLAVLVMLLVAAGRANASDGCGQFGEPCCSAPNSPCSFAFLACSPAGTCLFADGQECDHSNECASGFCQTPETSGTCVRVNPAPAVSNYTAAFIGSALLLAGLWSVRRVSRRR